MIRLYFRVFSTECLAADKCVIISKYIEYQDMVKSFQNGQNAKK